MTMNTASLLLSAVVAIATVVYAVLTWKLVTETSRLRAQADARIRAETAELIQNILSEYSRTINLVRRVEGEVQTFAGLTGNVGSSWYQQRTSELQALPVHLKILCKTAEEQVLQNEVLLKRSTEDLSSLSTRLFSDLAQLRVEHEKLRDELDDLRGQNQQHRAINLRRVP